MKPALPSAPRPVHPYVVLGICCFSLLLIGMDATIVNVALPSIQKDLHASLAGLQWIVDAYTIVLASLLIFSGSLSDRYGRRRVFQAGFTIFCLASLLCSLSQSIGSLIAYRALQGLGASMLNPVALSILVHAFPDPKARTRAIGTWGAMMGIAMAAGPVLGGALTQAIGWRSIFWINLPICVAAIAGTAWFIPESRAARFRAFDPAGQTLAFVALASLTYAIIEGPQDGWGSARIVGLFAITGLSVILFFWIEPRRRAPLIDPRFFRSIPFSSTILLALLAYSAYAAFLFLNVLYLQQERGLTAFQTGLCTLPFALMIIVTAPLSGHMVARSGARGSTILAGTSLLISSLLLTGLHLETPLGLLIVSYMLFGIGLGMINPAITNNAVSGMPMAQAGVAGGIASTSRQVGTALGVAIAGTIVSTSRAHGLNFTQATHPIWWAMTVSAALILLISWLSTTPWAFRSTAHVAELFETPAAGSRK